MQEAAHQSGLRTQLQQETDSHAVRNALAQQSALDKLPTGPPVAAPHSTAPAEGSPVGDIRIPVIGINQVMVEGTNTPDLRKGPGHYTGTPLPGQTGNAAVAGHRTTYGHPFYNLDSVKVGDPIVVTTLQGVFVYDTTKSFVVSPSDTSVVADKSSPTNSRSRPVIRASAPRPGSSSRRRWPTPSCSRTRASRPSRPRRSPTTTRTARAWPATRTSGSPSAVLWGFLTRRRRRGHLLRRLSLPSPALADLRGGRRRARWSCCGSSSAPSARCSPPASSRRVLVDEPLGGSLPRLRRHGRARRRQHLSPPSAAASPTTPTSCPSSTARRSPSGDPCSCWPPCTPPAGSGPTTLLAAYYDTVAPRARRPLRPTTRRRRRGRVHGLLPDAPRRARAARSPPVRPRPTRSVAAPPCCPGSATSRRSTTGTNPCPCSTSAPRPGSTSSSTTTPTPTGPPTGTPPDGRHRAERRRPSGSSGDTACRRAPTSATCPTSDCPPWPSGSDSTCRRSTPSPTMRPAGCWPASGRTTRPASVACAAPWPTCGRRRTRPGSSAATCSRTCDAWPPPSPGSGPLVVFHSWVAAYLSETEQRTLFEQVAALGAAIRPGALSLL